MDAQYTTQSDAHRLGRDLLVRQLGLWQTAAGQAVKGDADSLHRWRVAGRRINGALRLLQVSGDPAARDLRRRLQALLGATSPARDIDVQIAGLARLATGSSAALPGVRRRLRAERRRQQPALRRALAGPSAVALALALGSLAAAPPTRPSGMSAGEAAERELCRGVRRLRQAAASLGKRASARRVHRLRLRAKKLRYLAEPFVPLYGLVMRRYLARLRTLVDVLGRVTDAQEAERQFEALALASTSAARRDAALGLAAQSRRERREAARDIPGAARRATGKRWRRLRRALRRGHLAAAA